MVHKGRDYGERGATWGRAVLTPELLLRNPGTDARNHLRPPGFISGADPHQHNRGHLVARSLGGSGRTMENLVTLFRIVNHPRMYEQYEKPVRERVEGCDIVDYVVTPDYNDLGALPVHSLRIVAESRTSSWFLTGNLYNH